MLRVHAEARDVQRFRHRAANLPMIATPTAVPGERIVSRSRAEARVAFAIPWQARMWPKALRQTWVLCAEFAAAMLMHLGIVPAI